MQHEIMNGSISGINKQLKFSLDQRIFFVKLEIIYRLFNTDTLMSVPNCENYCAKTTRANRRVANFESKYLRDPQGAVMYK